MSETPFKQVSDTVGSLIKSIELGTRGHVGSHRA